MKNLKLIACFSLLILLNSCSKENITFTGRILTSCSGAPFANVDLTLWVDVNCLSLYPCYETYVAKTDANGNFSLTIPEGIIMEIRVGSSTILFGIPANKSLNLGTFYAHPTTSFVYRIKVNNPYQLGDTLHLELKSTFSRYFTVMPAPLHDSLFTLAEFGNVNSFSSITTSILDNIPIHVGRTIFHDNINISSNWYVDESFTYNSAICNSKIDTLTIEIN